MWPLMLYKMIDNYKSLCLPVEYSRVISGRIPDIKGFLVLDWVDHVQIG